MYSLVISRRQQSLEALDLRSHLFYLLCGCPYGGDVGRVYGQGSDAVAFSFRAVARATTGRC